MMGRRYGDPRLRIATFLFHEVVSDPSESGFQRPSALPYKHRPREFRALLDRLARSPVRPSRIFDVDFGCPGRHLMITFDDGGASAIRAAEELQRRGWRAHFFITTDLIGKKGFLDVAQITDLRAEGHVIGSHSSTHPDVFRSLSEEQMLAEWRASKERLEALLGEPCRVASVPGGMISAKVVQMAGEAGYEFLFTSEPRLRPWLLEGCVALGRVCPKRGAGHDHVERLARFQVVDWLWEKAMRRARLVAKRVIPALSRPGRRPSDG